MEKLTLSVSELAKTLGVWRNVAYELVQRNDFPSIRLSARRIVIPVSKLNIWLEQNGKTK